MVLEGRFGRVEKLDAARHGAALAEAVLGWRLERYGDTIFISPEFLL
jgi:hypothetical protein